MPAARTTSSGVARSQGANPDLMKRRNFLQVSGLTAGALCFNPEALLFGATQRSRRQEPFSFVMLGDLHFARWEHYDAANMAEYATRVCKNTETAWDALCDEIDGQLREGEPRPS